jgi:hypothetical protein
MTQDTHYDIEMGYCFPMALINAHRYYGMNEFTILSNQLIKAGIKKHGGTNELQDKKLIELYSLLNFKLSSNINNNNITLQKNSILIIKHPIYGDHAVWHYIKNKKHFIVNSLMAGMEDIVEISINKLRKIVSKNSKHFVCEK